MKYQPMHLGDGKIVLHHEDIIEAQRAIDQGWTDDELLFSILESQGINYPNKTVELRKIDKGLV